MDYTFDLDFNDFNEEIVHAIRDHVDRYNQERISYVLADYLTVQNLKATDSKIGTVAGKYNDLEAQWRRELTSELGYMLDRLKKIFINKEKYKHILNSLQEKKATDDERDLTKKRKRDEEIREAAERKKRAECREYLANHPERNPEKKTAPLPQIPQDFQGMMMNFMAHMMSQQMMPSFHDIKTQDVKYATSSSASSTSSSSSSSTSNRPRSPSVQSTVSTDNSIHAYALSRPPSVQSTTSSILDVSDIRDGLRAMDIQSQQ